MNPAGLLLLMLACQDAPTTDPEATAPAPTDPAAAPAASPAASPAAAATPTGTWTAETIGQLALAPPQRQAKVPLPRTASPELEATLRMLGEVVDSGATDPGNPWAIGHGLLARGADLQLSNGQPAVDWVFAEYAQPMDAQGAALLQFPEAKGAVRIEPHADLLLKALSGAGVDPSLSVTVQGKAYSVGDLWRGSLLRTHLVPERNHSRYASPDDVAWSLQGLATWAPPELAWVALDGTAMQLDTVADFGASVLYAETRFLMESMTSGQPFQRKGQGIFRYTCGGAHVLQAVSVAVARGFGSPRLAQVLDEQVLLQHHRYAIETGIYQQALAAFPEHQEKLTVQRLKFAGHFLESMSMLQAMGVYSPDAAQQADLDAAVTEIQAATAALSTQGLLADLDAVRARDEQLYLDIVGDSAHALRGLELALGRAQVAW